jgi:hypothetical protein
MVPERFSSEVDISNFRLGKDANAQLRVLWRMDIKKLICYYQCDPRINDCIRNKFDWVKFPVKDCRLQSH